MPRINPLERAVTIELDGEQLPAREGEPVAVALVAAGVKIFSRSPKYHRPRGPFCLVGGCAHCLMRVDGVPNVPTCQIPVTPGMRLERQNAMPDARLDFLRINDFVFRDWFNHHEFLAGVPIAEGVLQKIARHLSGLGVLADKAAAEREPAVVEAHDLVVVGAGAAGLAAIHHLTERGVPHVVFERDQLVGGRLMNAAEHGQPVVRPAPHARLNATVVGLYSDAGRPFLAVLQQHRLHLIFYRRALLALGGHAPLPTFPNNDLPGVMSGRAVALLLRRHGVLAGRTVACTGDPVEARALAELIRSSGGEAIAIGESVLKAHGLRCVDAVTTEPGGRQPCDVIAVCHPVSPAFELARAAGATVSWAAEARCFVVDTDGRGQTANPSVFVAGEMRGPMSSAAAAEQGLAAADALANAGARPPEVRP
jgi:sarcosine oxidase, subunit alpha